MPLRAPPIRPLKPLKEIRKGGEDTHALALAATNQAEAAKIQSDNTALVARAAERSAEIANRQASLTDETLKRSHRPWVGVVRSIEIEKPVTFSNNGSVVGFKFVLKNTGNSPAIGVENSISFYMMPTMNTVAHITTGNCPARAHPNQIGGFILPGETWTTDLSDIRGIKVSPMIGPPAPSAWLTMCIVYNDEFATVHGTGLVWQYIPFANQDAFKYVKPGTVVPGFFRPIGTTTNAY